jgi:outer membrane protein G
MEFNIGAMYEIENVESQGEDKDGLYEPPCGLMQPGMPGLFRWRCIRKGRLISSMTRGTYFDRPEFELRYRFIGTDDFTFGLTGGFRNYGYHFKG